MTRSIDALASGESLSREEAAAVLSEIMRGEVSEIQIAAFLIALRTKGETVEEIAGLAQAMRSFAARVEVSRDDLLDTAGTGGGRRTFNVSTTAALIAAGAGCVVAKHGNRSATGLSGSADVLEALGARIDLRPEAVAACIEDVGFGFMFAPSHHQATRYVIPVRRELAVRTIFNFLGPLTNPAGATRQLIGVSDPAYIETIAGALALLGTRHAVVVSSDDGIDELSISSTTQVVEVLGDEVRRYAVSPEELGLERAPAEAVPGGDPAENAETTRRIFAGEPGPARELAVLNAGAAIYAGGGADTLEGGRARRRAGDRPRRGGRAARAVRGADQGAGALNKLEEIVQRTRAEVAQRRERSALGRGRGSAAAAPVRRCAPASRPVADRRAQAQLALGGGDPGGSEPRGRGRGVRARRRRGAVDPDRGAELRRLAR